jgi:hypothetical protein
MTKGEVKHINWMYNRLISVHNENPNYDYMLKFKEIIDKQLTITDVSRHRKLLSFVEVIRDIADMELHHWSNQEVVEYCLKKLYCG